GGRDTGRRRVSPSMSLRGARTRSVDGSAVGGRPSSPPAPPWRLIGEVKCRVDSLLWWSRSRPSWDSHYGVFCPFLQPLALVPATSYDPPIQARTLRKTRTANKRKHLASGRRSVSRWIYSRRRPRTS